SIAASCVARPRSTSPEKPPDRSHRHSAGACDAHSGRLPARSAHRGAWNLTTSKAGDRRTRGKRAAAAADHEEREIPMKKWKSALLCGLFAGGIAAASAPAYAQFKTDAGQQTVAAGSIGGSWFIIATALF